MNKKVHFSPQVEVYQPIGQTILLKKQALRDESTNPVVSFFQQRRIQLRQLMHEGHLARKSRRAERAQANERLLQDSSPE